MSTHENGFGSGPRVLANYQKVVTLPRQTAADQALEIWICLENSGNRMSSDGRYIFLDVTIYRNMFRDRCGPGVPANKIMRIYTLSDSCNGKLGKLSDEVYDFLCMDFGIKRRRPYIL